MDGGVQTYSKVDRYLRVIIIRAPQYRIVV